MRVAPIDIAHKTFGRKIYGLDTEEVYDFLRDVADEFETLSRQHQQLEEKLKNNEISLEDYKKREETLKQTLQTASQMSCGSPQTHKGSSCDLSEPACLLTPPNTSAAYPSPRSDDPVYGTRPLLLRHRRRKRLLAATDAPRPHPFASRAHA